MNTKSIKNEHNIIFYHVEKANKNSTIGKISVVRKKGNRKVKGEYISSMDKMYKKIFRGILNK